VSQHRPASAEDPRPLTGEPLSLDLLNTRWIDDSGPHDLLDSTDGLATWLRSTGLDGRAPADDATLEALVRTREILLTLVDTAAHETAHTDDPSTEAHADAAAATRADEPPTATRAETLAGIRPEARERLNHVLDHGALRHRLTPGGPETYPETDTPAWLPAWLAAADYLRLLSDTPGRIKSCARSGCVLHFLDTTKNGTRRWCSMAICGNRAKAARHYQRTKSQGA
jgi:predicted RNA-binding Zn ribbon-like protein